MNKLSPPTRGLVNGPARQTEISSQLEDIGRAIAGLTENWAELIERLNPILRSEPSAPPCPGPEKSPLSVNCPLAGQLQDRGDKIRALAGSIREIIGRLEL